MFRPPHLAPVIAGRRQNCVPKAERKNDSRGCPEDCEARPAPVRLKKPTDQSRVRDKRNPLCPHCERVLAAQKPYMKDEQRQDRNRDTDQEEHRSSEGALDPPHVVRLVPKEGDADEAIGTAIPRRIDSQLFEPLVQQIELQQCEAMQNEEG
jgi:hypothetical protein